MVLNVVLFFKAFSIGHLDGIQTGACANLVALECMVKAHNEGQNYVYNGPTILKGIGEVCPALKTALDLWKDITFNYASTDTSDFAVTTTGKI